ncbi:radical SAM/SPASM domain-containing protein [candidate division CSSED10-310 bacterium]|uniref:Radical SAM/SPASM domain-containing protein n=1 Tax=candidate division CSSED10-310 bacterium TaxID=2855610 RepID=A0ABV6YUB8_UNCC1
MNALKKLDSLSKILIDYLNRRVRGRVLPVRLWLEPTNKCNLRCPICPQSADNKTPRGFMDKALFRKIIDEAKDFVYDINLSHRGESLFHEDIIDFISYAHQNGLRTRIHTNGTILTPELSRELILSGLDFLSFSFDGFDKYAYESSRVGARFEETLHNILTFLRIKQELNRKMPFTVIQIINTGTVPDSEFSEKRNNFVRYFDGLPLNKLYIKDPHNWGGNIKQETAEKLSQNQRYSPCTFCWYALTILWDGMVVPCPQDFFAQLQVGDLTTQSIKEIWRHSPLVNLRQKFVYQNIAGISPCEHCDRLFRRRLFGIPSVNMKEFLAEHMIGYKFLHNFYLKQWKKTGN